MITRMMDRLADWAGSDSRRTRLASGLIITPLWLPFVSFLVVPQDLRPSFDPTFFLLSMAIGVLGCFLLPTMSYYTRIVLAFVYVPACYILFTTFILTVGCLFSWATCL